MSPSNKKGDPTKGRVSQCNINHSLSLEDFQFVKISDFDHAYVYQDVILNPTFGGFIVSTDQKRLNSSPVSTDQAITLATSYLRR